MLQATRLPSIGSRQLVLSCPNPPLARVRRGNPAAPDRLPLALSLLLSCRAPPLLLLQDPHFNMATCTAWCSRHLIPCRRLPLGAWPLLLLMLCCRRLNR